ncbi:cell division protein FtsK/SpoIIIE [Caldicellulosiruptor kronotskyensis 2002]|uniref:Cell division protein FtsK/SpoIIIE n=1 Tax=Caldicellulosiruptor kronotskyensis (strain DSM 18902 / VKM B-2412 / 2002) TaxID=632348 RepID=E4SFM8_CALK2|nr:DNA translocase FtsK [Caldicellulosiruptor kronotskyensis]ADQ46553.1 cell division protein FtsK/SpoIIIE [Caldicellulosiruptor kronotskyensis 2002]
MRAKAVSKKKRYKIKKEVFDRLNAEVYGTFLFFVFLIFVFSVATDKVGIVGDFVKKTLLGCFGVGVFLILAFMLYVSLDSILRRPRVFDKRDIIVFTYILLIFMIFTTFIQANIKPYDSFIKFLKDAYFDGLNFKGFGVFGSAITYPFVSLFGFTGTLIICFSTLIIMSMIVFSFSIRGLLKKKKPKDTQQDVKREEEITEEENIKLETNGFYNFNFDTKTEEKKSEEVPVKSSKKGRRNDKTADKKIFLPSSEQYLYPPVDYLKKPNDNLQVSRKDINENIRKLEETLKNFGIEAQVTEVSVGPTITRYELQPGQGVKVSRIVNLSDDIALALAAPSVRIEAPIPNKSAIGIEIPNREPKPVYIRELIESPDFYTPQYKIPFAIGKDVAGTPVIADITKMPHLLIAGATGSGKSVCINSLIISILYRCMPDEVKLILIDPKVVELSLYNGIPHLLIPVVTDAKKAANALAWAVQEMTNRYKLFAAAGVRDIVGYNKWCEENGQEKLPYIVIIIDELADLMMVSPAEVEDSICRLAQMARAAGMHLVVATQRPSVDVITGLIKANIPSRIAFAVSSQVDSRTILDQAGAEKLLGRGDMLYLPIGLAKPMRVQGAYVSESEVEKVVEFLKQNFNIEYNQEVIEEINSKVLDVKDDKADELLIKAIQLVVEAQNVSTSFLQRKLRIGYSRAARLIDQMEERGIISKMDSTGKRQVLITKEQFDEMLMNME